MQPLATISKSYDLISTGVLSWPLGVLVTAFAGGFVLWQLHRELRGESRRQVRRVLMAIRVGVVLLATWLLLQPLLVVTRSWTVQPEVWILPADRPGMAVRQDLPLYLHLEQLTAGDQAAYAIADAIRARNVAAAANAQVLNAATDPLTDSLAALAPEIDALASGWPPGPSFAATIATLRERLTAARTQTIQSNAGLPDSGPDDAATATLSDLRNRLQVLLTDLQAAATQTELVAREAAKHPDLLEGLSNNVAGLRDRAAALATEFATYQNARDIELIAALPEAQRPNLTPLTRRSLVQGLAASFQGLDVATPQQPELALTVRHAEPAADLGAQLRAVIARQLEAPVSDVIVVDDGSAAPSAADLALVATLREGGVHVHAALAGIDGAEPRDAGLLAFEAPGIAIRGQPVTVRAYVKNRLGEGVTPRLVLRQGDQTLAEAPVSIAGNSVVELRVTFENPGPTQLVATVETPDGEPDAFPGNESDAATLEVYPRPPRILILSDHLSADFALYQGVAASFPGVELQPLIGDPELARLRTGGDLDEFPETAKHWDAVDLAVLIGTVPAAIPDAAIDALKAAIEAGQQVIVQSAPAVAVKDGETPSRSWAAALGLSLQPLSVTGTGNTTAARLVPRHDIWPALYALGVDRPESLARWAALPPLPASTQSLAPADAAKALPLFASSTPDADSEIVSPLALLPRGQGLLLFNGIPRLGALRQDGNAESVNRLVAAWLTLGLTRWHGDAFPAQPVTGTVVYHRDGAPPTTATAGGDAGLIKGAALPRAEASPAVTEMSAATVPASLRALNLRAADGTTTERQTRQLRALADFQLEARAAPLRALAEVGGGAFVDLRDADPIYADIVGRSVAQPRSAITTWRLWAGWWPLMLLLAMVTGEYLLRRRAGRVM